MLHALLALIALAAPPKVSAQVETGRQPCGAVAAYGAVWVANDGSGTLARIDPRTNRVTRRVRVGRGACYVAAGGGALWVTYYRTGSVVRVSRLLAKRTIRVGKEPFDVVVTGKRVWVALWGAGELAEIHTDTARVVRRIDVGGHPAGLLARNGSIWVGFGRTATAVARVDPASGEVTRIQIGVKAPGWFASGGRNVWITADSNALVRLDAESGRVVGLTRLGLTLGQPAVAHDGSVWVPDKQIDTVFRVDPRTGKPIGSFAGGDGALAALRAFGSMWVTSYAGDDVWRFG
jgi:streptogramin lyase